MFHLIPFLLIISLLICANESYFFLGLYALMLTIPENNVVILSVILSFNPVNVIVTIFQLINTVD